MVDLDTALQAGNLKILLWTAVALGFLHTILGTIGVLMMGVSRIPLGKRDRWSTTFVGLSLVLCGVAIQWLGL